MEGRMLASWSSGARKALALASVMGTLVVSLAFPFSAAAAAPVTTFSLSIGDSCVGGHSAPNAHLNMRLTSSTGQYLGSFKVVANPSGDWFGCFGTQIDAGQRITANDGTHSRTYPVIRLDYSVDRVTNVISGTTTPNSSVKVSVDNCQDSWYNCSTAVDVTAPSSSTGAFSSNFTGTYDIRGGDYTQVHWVSGQGDDQYASRYAPFFEGWLNNPFVWGIADSNASVSVRLLANNGVLKATLRERADFGEGYFQNAFAKNGLPVSVALDDTLVANFASDARLRVINFQPHFAPGMNTITARCYKNAAYAMYVSRPDNSDGMQAFGTTDSNGQISINTISSDSYDLKPGDRVDFQCRNALGDMLQETFSVQYQ
jgi:hypothetical protein